MPIKLRKDYKGYYYQYGTTGHKYYFNPNNNYSMNSAYRKALKQSAAIRIKKFK
jgi:hypothetical protein